MRLLIATITMPKRIAIVTSLFLFAAILQTFSVIALENKGRSSITFEFLPESVEYTVKSPHLLREISVASAREGASTKIFVSTDFDKAGFHANDVRLFAISKSQKRVPATTQSQEEEEFKNGSRVTCEITATFSVPANQIERLVIENSQPNLCGAISLELINDGTAAKTKACWGPLFDCDEKCQSTVSSEKLSLTVPAGVYDLMPGKPLNAPFAVHQVSGDFSFRVKVSGDFKPGKNLGGGRGIPYNGAGILVWEDEKNFLRVERNAFWGGDGILYTDSPLIEHWQDFQDMGVNPGGGIDSTDFFQGRSTWFQVQRKKADVTVSISHDNQQWKDIKTIETDFADELFVGVLAINTSNADFTVDFEEYRLTADHLLVNAEYKTKTPNDK